MGFIGVKVSKPYLEDYQGVIEDNLEELFYLGVISGNWTKLGDIIEVDGYYVKTPLKENLERNNYRYLETV